MSLIFVHLFVDNMRMQLKQPWDGLMYGFAKSILISILVVQTKADRESSSK